jgi:hypothetical protein
MAINNPRLVQIVRGHLHIHLVADGDANEIFPHFAGDMREDFVPVGQRDTEHCARKHLRHTALQFDWFFFGHNVVGPLRVLGLRFQCKKSIFFHAKKVDKCRRSAKFPPTMKLETLNGILTFVLGMLVVAGVILAVRMVMLHHDLRSLQREATRDQSLLVQTEQMYGDAAAFNQKNPSPELAHILQIVVRPAPATH